MRLALPMIGVLTQDDDLHLVQWCMSEGVEELTPGGKDALTLLFLKPQELAFKMLKRPSD